MAGPIGTAHILWISPPKSTGCWLMVITHLRDLSDAQRGNRVYTRNKRPFSEALSYNLASISIGNFRLVVQGNLIPKADNHIDRLSPGSPPKAWVDRHSILQVIMYLSITLSHLTLGGLSKSWPTNTAWCLLHEDRSVICRLPDIKLVDTYLTTGYQKCVSRELVGPTRLSLFHSE
jgi:hypothetical protein